MVAACLVAYLVPNSKSGGWAGVVGSFLLQISSTYRLQLSKQFRFDDAGAYAGYFASLGVAHLYCSPVLQAAPGSNHGYDVVDPTRVAEDLGGEVALRRLVAVLHEHELALLVDIVPNHMATAGRANPWWWDMLRNGPSSRYANYFDIDWESPISAVKGKVLLGVLGDRYGKELERGALTLQREGSDAVVRYHDHTFPLSRESQDGLELDAVNQDIDALDAVLERQHYRLSYWRSAQEQLNYRRFFTIDSLIGLREEESGVFDDSHRVILDLVADGSVAGLRIDHVDGLRDPVSYLMRLRSEAPDTYVAVEKILAVNEELPDSFPVQGTTGYDFIAQVDGLFVDSRNEGSMTALYHAFTGQSQPFSEVVRTCKQEMMASELAVDVERLTNLLLDICDRHRRHRDRTRREVQEAIRELAAGLHVYRTYVRPGSPTSDQDQRQISIAAEVAARRRPDIDPDLLAFVAELLLMQHEGVAEAEFTARFQQLTPAVMAKGVEDTAFYRYNRLVSLNEVGGDPGVFGHSVEEFHSYCSRTAAKWPATMLTLSTHDTKRSGDVRARTNLLSEIPAEWELAVRRWAEHNERHRVQGYPDRNLEYLMYQTMVGAWPLDEARLVAFLQKAAREAKVHTSWINPVPAFDDALTRFAGSVLADAEFKSDLESFIGRHQLVALGRIASLAQTTLLLTCPGVPDVYQGTEVWNLSLVDPDNRRPVDYERLARLLSEVRSAGPSDVLARADEGAPKLWLITRLLEKRRLDPELFGSSSYAPLAAAGAKSKHAFGFARDRLVVVVPRLVVGLGGDWADTTIDLPNGTWRSLITGEEQPGGPGIQVAELMRQFPVAVLAQQAGPR
jgi:(1->4)-alpha-D-glucan 1-alpha-D-glucosylmutase